MNRNYQSTKYPYIIIPGNLVVAINASPEIPPKPSKPVLPNKPSEPSQDFKSDDGCAGLGSLIGFFTVVLSVLSVATGQITFFFVIIVIGGLAYYFLKIQPESEERNDYPRKYSHYLVEKKEYPEKIKEYEQSLANYELILREYEHEIAIITSDKEVRKLRKDLIYRQLSLNESTITNLKYFESTKKGVSESYFSKFLKSKFGDNIFLDVSFNGYYPDFVYYNKTTNILIDIEIDEPYVGHSGEPIHYTNGFDRVDKKRDDLFAQNGFIVIRFAEIQIFKNTVDCLNYIDRLINAMEIADFSFLKEEIIPIIPFWEKDKAHELGFKRYRHSYIPRNLHHLIEIEKDIE